MTIPGVPTVMFSRLLIVVCFTFAANVCYATALEPQTRHDPAVLLGTDAAGVNYRVEGPVMGDGFLRNYRLHTAYGDFQVRGDGLLKIRLSELRALAALKQFNGLETYGAGFSRAVAAPFEFVGGLVTKPVETLDETATGINEWFDRIGAGINNPDSNPDGTIASALGVSKVKRQLAFDLGVDPYTDFPPLAKRLNDLGQAGAAGEITVAAALTQVPGAAGMAASGVSTAGNVRALVRDKTAAQLQEMNQAKLKKLGISDKTTRSFLGNRVYTPTDQTAIATSLSFLAGIHGLDAFVARLAQAPTRDVAIFQRRRVDQLVAYHKSITPLRSFVMLKGFPFNRTATGRVVGIFPLDEFAWTETSAQLIRSVTEDLRRQDQMDGAEFRVTGTITPAARQNLAVYGWRSVDRVRY